MASSREDIASQALARLGEPSIDDFNEDSDTAEKVRQLYEPTIRGLLSRYEWDFASARAVLQVDGGRAVENEWTRAFALPAQGVDIVGKPYRVYNSTQVGASEIFEFELEGRHLLTNESVIVIEYTNRKPESEWPGYFEELAHEALAAKLALPVTESTTKEELHTVKAFGNPSDMGEGGLFGIAMSADARGAPTRSLLDESDPIAAARFGGRY